MIIRNIEELQIFSRWLRDILEKHCHCSKYLLKEDFRPVEINFRRKIGGNEVDMIITCSIGDSSRVIKRTIGFELKESDTYKAVDQAIKRRNDFTWFYVVLDISVEKILSLLRNKPIMRALEYGIGFVSGKDDVVVISSYMKQNIHYSASYMNLFDFLGGENAT